MPWTVICSERADEGHVVFKGISDLLRIASELADSVQDQHATVQVHRGGGTGIPKTLRATYGVAVRVGPRSGAVLPPFGLGAPDVRPPAEGREPLADVIDEGDHYVILVELPGADGTHVRWEVTHARVVVIRARSAARAYSKTIELPVPVDAETAVASYENGILELKLWKH